MKSLSYLNKYLIKYKWRLIFGIICIIVSNYFGVKMPTVVSNAVNGFLGEIKSDESFNTIAMLSLKLFGFYMLLSIGKGFFLFLTRQTIIVMSRHIEFDLKNEVYNQYQRLNFSFYKKMYLYRLKFYFPILLFLHYNLRIYYIFKNDKNFKTIRRG